MALNREQIARSREILLDKRLSLMQQVERLTQDAAESTEATENSKSPLNSAENASDTYEQDFAFMSIESEEEILRKIETALERIQENTYGECDECRQAINPERLEAIPWATMCVKCQELEERGLRQRTDEADFEMADESEEALIGDDRERV